MKILLTLIVTLFTFSLSASELTVKDEDVQSKAITSDVSCKVELRYSGIWWTECPRGSLASGADARVTSVPFVNVRVKCFEPVIVCESNDSED